MQEDNHDICLKYLQLKKIYKKDYDNFNIEKGPDVYTLNIILQLKTQTSPTGSCYHRFLALLSIASIHSSIISLLHSLLQTRIWQLLYQDFTDKWQFSLPTPKAACKMLQLFLFSNVQKLKDTIMTVTESISGSVCILTSKDHQKGSHHLSKTKQSHIDDWTRRSYRSFPTFWFYD